MYACIYQCTLQTDCTLTINYQFIQNQQLMNRGYRVPSLQWTSQVAMRFIIKCGITHFLCTMRSSGIIFIPQATFVPNFVSFAIFIAKLTHGEQVLS